MGPTAKPAPKVQLIAFLSARHVTLSYFTLRRLLCLGTGNVLVYVRASLQGHTIFDGDARCIDVTHNGGRFLQLSALEAVQVSFQSALHLDATSLQDGADTSLRPDSKATVEPLSSTLPSSSPSK
jgi:hypothetical protein